MNDIDSYQNETVSKRLYFPKCDHEVIYPALGLSGEVGEFQEKIKKVFRDKEGQFSPEDLEALKLELGDIMWNLVSCAQALGFKMSDVLEANIKKCESRRSRGKVQGSGDNR